MTLGAMVFSSPLSIIPKGALAEGGTSHVLTQLCIYKIGASILNAKMAILPYLMSEC